MGSCTEMAGAKDIPLAECNSCSTEGRFPIVQVPYDAVYGFDAQVSMCPYCYAMNLANALLAIQQDDPNAVADIAGLPRSPFTSQHNKILQNAKVNVVFCSCQCNVCENCEGQQHV